MKTDGSANASMRHEPIRAGLAHNMSLTLTESQAVNDLAALLYDFLPGSGNNNTAFPLRPILGSRKQASIPRGAPDAHPRASALTILSAHPSDRPAVDDVAQRQGYETLSRNISFTEVIARKVRRAGETGMPFVRVRDLFLS